MLPRQSVIWISPC